jgi:hypothetical protein
LTIYSSKGPITIEPVEDKGGSPGSKIPAVFQYDPSGLRSSMTSNHAALEAALEKIEPTHLPTEPWMLAGSYEALLKEREDKGLPPPIGSRYKPKYVSANTNTVRW